MMSGMRPKNNPTSTFFYRMRVKALQRLKRACRGDNKPFPVAHLVELMCFEDVQEVIDICTHVGLTIDPGTSGTGDDAGIDFKSKTSVVTEPEDDRGECVNLQPRKSDQWLEPKWPGGAGGRGGGAPRRRADMVMGGAMYGWADRRMVEDAEVAATVEEDVRMGMKAARATNVGGNPSGGAEGGYGGDEDGDDGDDGGADISTFVPTPPTEEELELRAQQKREKEAAAAALKMRRAERIAEANARMEALEEARQLKQAKAQQQEAAKAQAEAGAERERAAAAAARAAEAAKVDAKEKRAREAAAEKSKEEERVRRSEEKRRAEVAERAEAEAKREEEKKRVALVKEKERKVTEAKNAEKRKKEETRACMRHCQSVLESRKCGVWGYTLYYGYRGLLVLRYAGGVVVLRCSEKSCRLNSRHCWCLDF